MVTYTALFWQLQLSPSPVALCASLMRASSRNDKEAIGAALAGIRDAIRRSTCDHAISAARTLLVLSGPVKAIARMKRAGVLRASSFDFHAPAIAAIAADWVEHADDYGLGPHDVTYLTSVANLCGLAPAVRALYRGIVEQLCAGQAAILKSLLAEVDASFVDPDPVDIGYGEERPATREELAEAFSYLLHLFDARIVNRSNCAYTPSPVSP